MTTKKNDTEFSIGHDDAFYERGYKPTTVAYVDGYESGLALRKILRDPPLKRYYQHDD